VPTLRLLEVVEVDALPLRESVRDFLTLAGDYGRLELLPGCRRRVREWSPAAAWIAGGALPDWWSADPMLDCAPVELYRIPNAYYLPGFGIVISSSGDVYAASAAHARYYTPDLGLLPSVEIDGGTPVLTLDYDSLPALDRAAVSMPWGARNNYGHFVLDCLTGLAALMEVAELDGYVRVFPPLHTWQARHLDLLGVQERVELESDIYFVKDLVFCSTMRSALHRPNVNFQALRRRQLARLDMSASEPRAKVYIARRASPKRNFLTDDEVCESLTEIGFRAYYPEDHSVDEQIAVFHGADVVVGCAGAAFANALYCKPRTKIVELIPLRMVTGRQVSGVWVANLCALTGCQWLPYFCESWPTVTPRDDEEDRAELNTTFELDIDEFLGHLRAVGALG
jgi:capsular polysaccharide biosynthesis protein